MNHFQQAQDLVGLAHISPDDEFLSINETLCSLLGYSRKQLRTLCSCDIAHGDDQPAVRRTRSKFITGEIDSHTARRRYIRGNGTVAWLNVSETAIHDDNGHLLYTVSVMQDVSHVEHLTRQLTYQATHDRLTGLINRYEFEKQTGDFLHEIQQAGMQGAACYLDLDQFKLINDTAGHIAGDRFLCEVATLIQQILSESDIVGRLSGDEFGILLRNRTSESAMGLADQLRRAIENHRFQWENSTFLLGASIGIVPLHPGSQLTVTQTLRTMDSACNAAKDAGRNRVVLWSAKDAVLDRQHSEMCFVPLLNQALENDRFRLRAQPITPLRGTPDTPPMYELLLSLPDKGTTIPPNDFLPAAERYGLSSSIDQWVVHNALRWLNARIDHLPEDSIISINLSGLSITDPSFRTYLPKILRRNPDVANRLCFEITETAAISSLADAVELMHELRKLGTRFALDDFGCGLSSFAYLKNLPVDYLKIDGEFVREMQDDPMSLAIIQAITEIGRVTRTAVIAEYVETREIAELLTTMGVDYAQGHWIGHPVPIEWL